MNTTDKEDDIIVSLAYENGEEIPVIINEIKKQYTIREFIDDTIAHLNEDIPNEEEKIKTENLYNEEGLPIEFFVTLQRGNGEPDRLEETTDDGQIKHIRDFDFQNGDRIKLQYDIIPG